MHSLPRLHFLEVGAFALSQVRGLSIYRLDCLEEIVLAEGCMNEIEVQYIAGKLKGEKKELNGRWKCASCLNSSSV